MVEVHNAALDNCVMNNPGEDIIFLEIAIGLMDD
jgi:hypothetical protein